MCVLLAQSNWIKWLIVMLPQQVSQSLSNSSLASLGSRRGVAYQNDGVRWMKFHDGFPNLFIDDVKNVRGRDGELLFSCEYWFSYRLRLLVVCLSWW